MDKGQILVALQNLINAEKAPDAPAGAAVLPFPASIGEALERQRKYQHYNDGTVQWEEQNGGVAQVEKAWHDTLQDPRYETFGDKKLLEVLVRKDGHPLTNFEWQLYGSESGEAWLSSQREINGYPGTV